MKDRKEFNIRMGERIRVAREAAGYTQDALSELVDVSAQYVSDLERGVVGTSIPTLLKLCDVLSVSSDYLLGRKAEGGGGPVVELPEIAGMVRSLGPEEQKVMCAAIGVMMDALRLTPS